MHPAHRQRVTAIIPAAGRATRLGSTISGSKEVVDIGGRPAVSYLLERLATAGIDRALIALRAGKLDIPAVLVGETLHGLSPAYVVLDDSPSPTHSVAHALRFAAADVVALAFPDVIFEPHDAFAQMLEQLDGCRADIVLGLFPSAAPERVDMVRMDETNRVIEIVIKQPDQGLRYCWTLAVWTPRFSAYMLDRLRTHGHRVPTGEFQIGDVIQAAIDDGMPSASVVFETGGYLDIGTPGDLEKARRGLDGVGGIGGTA
jgi:glucose-1-phosphate thymidylyltransferase